MKPLPVSRTLPNRIVFFLQAVVSIFLILSGLGKFFYCGILPMLAGAPFLFPDLSAVNRIFVRKQKTRLLMYLVCACIPLDVVLRTEPELLPIISAIMASEMFVFELLMGVCVEL